MKLLVRNLPRTFAEEALREMFAKYGAVQSCTLVMDPKTGMSKGFGFVEMPRPGEAKAAVKNLNGTALAGMKIRVKKAQAKAPADKASEVQAQAEVPISPYKRV